METHLTWLPEYEALTRHAAIVDFSRRTQVELRGVDRAAFLHNLCTNEIRKLPTWEGCEAYLLNVQGKILHFVLVFSGPDSLVLETVAGQGAAIRQHLDRYLIREKVEILDRTSDWAEWLLAGAECEALLKRIITHGELPTRLYASSLVTLHDTPVWLRRVDFAGPSGFLVDCRRGDWANAGSQLHQAGALHAGHAACEAVRIEAGFPLVGHEVSDKNLPQELNRDARAISFVKGCYLGQETVARIDALGHVNRLLVQIKFLGSEVPQPGAELTSDSQVVGHVTSATWSPQHSAPLALAYVRRGYSTLGTRFGSFAGTAEICELTPTGK